MSWPHLEPDHEEEHHDAELGGVQDRLRLGEQCQPERADDEAGREVAEHGAEADAAEQGHGHDGGAKQRDDFGEVERAMGVGSHHGS